LNYDIIVDPVSSGFNECYEKQILPALQEMASEDTVFVEDDEIKRLILPEMVKLIVNSPFMFNFDAFDEEELHDLLAKMFELHTN
jgi:hypothetical protein